MRSSKDLAQSKLQRYFVSKVLRVCFITVSVLQCSSNCVYQKGQAVNAYPAVLLGLPLRSVHVDLGSGGAVGELEETGEHAVVLRRVREDGVLEVHSMWNNAVVLIHPTREKKDKGKA